LLLVLRLAGWDDRRFGGAGDLLLFEGQFELVYRFRPCAKLVAAKTGELMLQLGDQDITARQFSIFRRQL
jgi:hypothetical protein